MRLVLLTFFFQNPHSFYSRCHPTGLAQIHDDVIGMWIFSFCQNEIEVQKLLRRKSALIEPIEPRHEIKISGETVVQKRNRDIRNQEKSNMRK